MAEQKKAAEELLLEFHNLEKNSKIKTRRLPSDNGVFLLDKNNPNDVEWYEESELKNDVNKAMKYAKASQAMEGLKVSDEQEKLILDVISGEISEEEFNQRAKQLANES
ncbi:antitoxin VbhA family protein [Cytobacillus oceanisediminis]|uniref:antitoxin VbhA family protein n=1 Tax=Cytobacillus oceanisediminis TaxID=665099 RepID=UPI0011A38170|nr:antitoxin VbhA family protein [Cytobacillus oceanisediminis]